MYEFEIHLLILGICRRAAPGHGSPWGAHSVTSRATPDGAEIHQPTAARHSAASASRGVRPTSLATRCIDFVPTQTRASCFTRDHTLSCT